jgi:hypothetical protein
MEHWKPPVKMCGDGGRTSVAIPIIGQILTCNGSEDEVTMDGVGVLHRHLLERMVIGLPQ